MPAKKQPSSTGDVDITANKRHKVTEARDTEMDTELRTLALGHEAGLARFEF